MCTNVQEHLIELQICVSRGSTRKIGKGQYVREVAQTSTAFFFRLAQGEGDRPPGLTAVRSTYEQRSLRGTSGATVAAELCTRCKYRRIVRCRRRAPSIFQLP